MSVRRMTNIRTAFFSRLWISHLVVPENKTGLGNLA